jgi:hypothetical protein
LGGATGMRARRATIARVLPLIAALAAAAGLGGCGDNSSAPSGSAGPSQPTPYQVVSEGKPIGPPPDRENIDAAARRIAAAGATGDCNRIADLYTIGSASGRTQQACQLITQIGATTPTAAEQYGKEAGVIDYATPSRGATLVMLRQADGLLHIAFTASHDTAPAAGTQLGKGADALAASAVEVIHSGDCDRFLELAYREGGIGLLGPPQVCFVLANDPIHGATFDAPGARPRPLGGNAYFAFYELNTPRAYVLTVLVRAGLAAGTDGSGGTATGPYRYLASYSADRVAGF